ncbi:MAG: hypothetical protein AAGA08_21140, partial [Pseudomonadota bacterium]
FQDALFDANTGLHALFPSVCHPFSTANIPFASGIKGINFRVEWKGLAVVSARRSNIDLIEAPLGEMSH